METPRALAWARLIVVKRLFVKEGDSVAKGQVVLLLSDTEPRAKLDVLQVEDSAVKATEARLIADYAGGRNGSTIIRFPPSRSNTV